MQQQERGRRSRHNADAGQHAQPAGEPLSALGQVVRRSRRRGDRPWAAARLRGDQSQRRHRPRGLRVGYLLTAPDLVARLADAQPPWSVSSLALVAAQACSSPGAVAAAAAADDLAERRQWLAGRLGALPGVRVVPRPAASFLLLHVPDGLGVRARLRTQGVAVRRGDTFPGLGSDWLRLAVRDHDTHARVAVAFSHALSTTALSTTALSTTEGET